MAFDGYTIAALSQELNNLLVGGRIVKVTHPEEKQVVLNIKNGPVTYKLMMQISAQMPLIYITKNKALSPLSASSFNMVLRKHIQGALVEDIYQPKFERVINIKVRHLNEMGDTCHRILTFELMGRYSNLILYNEDETIVDALIRVGPAMSSVRTVLPGCRYFIPESNSKSNPLEETKEGFLSKEQESLQNNYMGISSFMNAFLSGESKEETFGRFERSISDVKNANYKFNMIMLNGRVFDYIVFDYSMDEIKAALKRYLAGKEEIESVELKGYDCLSDMLYDYYNEKSEEYLLKQKSGDLIKNINTILSRDKKKLKAQTEQLKDADERDKYKIYGELLNVYSYQIEPNIKSVTVDNYYTNEKITIPLKESMNAIANANMYYQKYNKLKRSVAITEEQMQKTKEDIAYLEDMLTFITFSRNDEDLDEIRKELADRGFIRKKNKLKKATRKSKPLHYNYKGYDIYVGKNNYQNEHISFDVATGNDWWFHVKNAPGSHVIVRNLNANQSEEWDMEDEIFALAAGLAAHYSSKANSDKAEIDYTRKKHLKKVTGAAKGYVIYHTNYSMVGETDISGYDLKEVQ